MIGLQNANIRHIMTVAAIAVMFCGCTKREDSAYLRVQARDSAGNSVWGIVTYIYDGSGNEVERLSSTLDTSQPRPDGSDVLWMRGHGKDAARKHLDIIRNGIRVISKRGDEVLWDATLDLSDFKRTDYPTRFFQTPLKEMWCIYCGGYSVYGYVKRIPVTNSSDSKTGEQNAARDLRPERMSFSTLPPH